MPNHPLSLTDVSSARVEYETRVPGDLFYKVATSLVSIALDGNPRVSIAEAIALMLQTWNKQYYQYQGGFKTEHFTEIKDLLSSHLAAVLPLRNNQIEMLDPSDQTTISRIFREFELILGPVGGAKCLHLLAPQYLPLWDNKIAKMYVGLLRKKGENGPLYWQFMCYASQQAKDLLTAGFTGNPVKAIDEFNYCHFSREWI